MKGFRWAACAAIGALASLGGASQCAAQLGTVNLRNDMDSGIVVFMRDIKTGDRSRVEIRQNSVLNNVNLTTAGPFDVQIVPNDERDKGFRAGILDLVATGKVMGTGAVTLKGNFEFQTVCYRVGLRGRRCRCCTKRVRTEVELDLISPTTGLPETVKAEKMEY